MRRAETFVVFTRVYDTLDGRTLSIHQDPDGNVTLVGVGCHVTLTPTEWSRLIEDMDLIRGLNAREEKP